MRIISGRFGRRKLLTNPGLVTRPITDRVKESLFNFLGDQVKNARVADVFAGTGTLGLEALSRGAESVVFYERDRNACSLLFKNIKALDVSGETFCWPTDVTKTSFRPKNHENKLPYDVVFFDPPYRFVSNIRPGDMLYRSLSRLGKEDICAEKALMLFRTPTRVEFELPKCWQLEQTDDYSTMQVHWYRLNRPTGPGAEPAEQKAEEPGTSDSQ